MKTQIYKNKNAASKIIPTHCDQLDAIRKKLAIRIRNRLKNDCKFFLKVTYFCFLHMAFGNQTIKEGDHIKTLLHVSFLMSNLKEANYLSKSQITERFCTKNAYAIQFPVIFDLIFT